MGQVERGAPLHELPEAVRFFNKKPFEHRCHHGVMIKANRCDFVGGVDVHIPVHVTEGQLAHDMFEVGWYHARNILPQLNGFSGGGVEYRIHRERPGTNPLGEG